MSGDVVRIGSLFSGYGGLDLAAQQYFGGELAWYSEIEPAACTILSAHHPGVPNLGDITKVDWAEVEPIDILTGGYPCQPFSQAGQRKGKEDERHLWPFVAVAIDALRPRIVVLENVRGHLYPRSERQAAAESVLRGMDDGPGVRPRYRARSATGSGTESARQRCLPSAGLAGAPYAA